MFNATINQTVNLTSVAYTGYPCPDAVIKYFDTIIIPRFMEIVTAPAQHPEMIWIVVPLAISLVLMQLYFGRNPTEKLGWNTAFGNSVALIFVCMNLLNHLYVTFGWTAFEIAWQSRTLKTVIALGVGVIGIMGMFLDLFHWLPERVAFFLGGAIPINLTAYMAIVLVYSDYVPIDRVTFVTSLFLFVALLLAFGLLKKFVPKSREAKMQIRAERERKRRARAKKRLQKRMLKLKKKAELQNL